MAIWRQENDYHRRNEILYYVPRPRLSIRSQSVGRKQLQVLQKRMIRTLTETEWSHRENHALNKNILSLVKKNRNLLV